MSERKVLNKYYPPDFDPSKIPKLKRPKDRQYVVRLMAPFNMRCKTCGEYIYKGRKFNARKETVQNELYLGVPIFRFYIKCTICLAEITFKTDPENTDYIMEHGATRNFQAEKLIEEEEKRIQQKREEEELNNPIKVLENRTRDSRLEMKVLENLQELKELNQRQARVDFESMLQQSSDLEKRRKEQEQEEDERELQEMLEMARVKRLRDSDSDLNSDSDQEQENVKKMLKRLKKARAYEKSTDILTAGTETYTKRVNVFGVKRKKCEFYSWGELKSLVSRKKPAAIARAQQPVAGTQTGIDAKPAEGTATALSLLQEYESSDSD
ncbi:splicing factor YJU2-like isoform X1 [Silurus meridionalis]|uniref:Splicing factor YJU2 n=1 Tax=Silurus meridionalis TaxID=175797 RepID=A0A8T0AP07_SILME|nr:splicing factor YJU2-like isoform X1 [Silurus meridionalis]KAF7692504.1 hypothetical protein HF521_010114 [Silurus meridionalis]